MKTLNFTLFGLALIAATLALSANLRGQTTTTYHGSGLNAYTYVSDSDYDDNTQTVTYIYASFGQEKQHFSGGAKDEYFNGDVYYSSYKYTDSGIEECYGYTGISNQPLFKGLVSASVSCTISLYCYSYNYETGEIELGTEDVTVDVLLAGFGSTTQSKYRYSEHDPSHFNSWYSSSGKSRQAAPTFLIDGELFTPSDNSYFYGYLGNGKWNSKTTINP